ncbi:anillin isoform X2 [Atheta coriaria]|uniref:anillin isoform X2 n=1 Tax=Dalotia coriaria TaxID=877792 RepID=UPI0031F44175
MDNSFTEHVLERARQRQKKLGPLREANVSTSSPNITHSELVRTRKEVVSDSILLTTPKMTKSNSKTKISSNISSSPSQEFNTLNIQKDSLNMEIRFSSAENVRVEVEIQSDDETGTPRAIVHEVTENTSTPTPADDPEGENEENMPALREEAKTRLQRLGKLYSGDEDLSSPISRTEGKFQIEEHKENVATQSCRPKKGLGKLAELANDINQWEDDITSSRKNMQERKVTTPKKWKPPAPQPPNNQSPKKTHGKPQAPKPPVVTAVSKKENDVDKSEKSAGKQLKWDKSVLDTLDKDTKDAITEQTEEENSTEHEVVVEEPIPKPKITKKLEKLPARKEENLVTPRSPAKNRGIASRAAMFEQNAPASPVKKEKDPALLSVSQRKALFEKNAGEALVPKAAFGMAAPISKIQPSPSINNDLNKKVESPVPAKKLKESGSIAEKIALLNKGASNATISQKQIEDKVKEDRQKEMDVLLNRFNKNKQVGMQPVDAILTDESDDSVDEDETSETTAMISSKSVAKVLRKSSDMPPPPPPPTDNRKSGEKRPKSGDSLQVQAVLGEVKRIKVTQPKDGKLYPCLSDIETNTETEPEASASPSNSSLNESYESESGANTSLGREVLKAMYTRHQQNDSHKRVSDCSTESNVSDVLADMNEYLNDIDSEDSNGPTPSKHGKLQSPQKTQPSQSFCYKKFSSPQKSPSKFRSPCKIVTSPRRDSGSNLPTHVVDGSDVLPLTYTVSFYRKQQTQGSTPVKQIRRFQEDEGAIQEEDSDKSMEVAEKIEQLTREVNKQQLVISQASSALNLCISTPEFTGSTEQVEAERLLLLASHRRQAANMEIQRLKIEKSLRPLAQHSQNLPIEKGTLVISNISLPLKKEYTKALAAAGGRGHHVVCLVKCGEQIAETQLVSTVAGSSKNLDVELVIPGQVKLTNVYSDFTMTLEVYCLQAQEEILSHEVKYHIGKKGSSKITPRKNKAENRMLRPPKESPAGPQAVRSSSFALNGYIIFSIQAINKTQWTLNQMPPISPLEGSVSMRVHCELNVSVEHRGFLNMFEDVSGLGAWHRRWCLLKGNLISYWKYPEDERKKAPIDTIDLRSCLTKTVGPVSRDICARLHTFLLERERPTQANDKETLTVSCHGHKTIIKHLLSADTKDERIEWCANLNKSLNALRMCGGGIKSTDF